jgi:hypothetical protein
VTRVIEKTTPAMVIIEPAMAPSKALAPSAPPVKVQSQLSVNHSVVSSSRATVAKANTIAPLAMTAGRNQKLERTRFHVLNRCALMTTLPHAFACPARPNDLLTGGNGVRYALQTFKNNFYRLVIFWLE